MKKLKILLAEDDPNISTIAQMALEKLHGHSVKIANNGEMALELAKIEEFDVLLLDEMMPKLNGINVCKRYLAESSSPKPVIFLSAKSQDSDIQEFKKLGAGYIAKPFDPMTLSQRILEILDVKKESA